MTVQDQVVAGLGAGVAVSFLACPTELAKCRLQVQFGKKPASGGIQFMPVLSYPERSISLYPQFQCCRPTNKQALVLIVHGTGLRFACVSVWGMSLWILRDLYFTVYQTGQGLWKLVLELRFNLAWYGHGALLSANASLRPVFSCRPVRSALSEKGQSKHAACCMAR